MLDCFIINWTLNIPDIIIWIIGLTIAFLFLVWRENKALKRENRQAIRELQGWFQDIFITDGIEAVLAYVSLIKLNNPFVHKDGSLLTPEFPIIALNRIRKIMGNDEIFYLIDNIKSLYYRSGYIGNKEEARSYVRDALIKIDHTEIFLTEFWNKLLVIEIPDKLSINNLKESEAISDLNRQCHNIRQMAPIK